MDLVHGPGPWFVYLRLDCQNPDWINKTWIRLRPIDKTRTGSQKSRIAINFRQVMTIRLFSDPVRVLSIGRNPIQVLLIRSDPVRILSIRSDPVLLLTPSMKWFFSSTLSVNFCFHIFL